jgi:hypothetical protein
VDELNDFLERGEKMNELLERWGEAMTSIAFEEMRIERECLQNNIKFDVVRRIADSTSWSLQKSLDFCLREKEGNREWSYRQTPFPIQKRSR